MLGVFVNFAEGGKGTLQFCMYLDSYTLVAAFLLLSSCLLACNSYLMPMFILEICYLHSFLFLIDVLMM